MQFRLLNNLNSQTTSLFQFRARFLARQDIMCLFADASAHFAAGGLDEGRGFLPAQGWQRARSEQGLPGQGTPRTVPGDRCRRAQFRQSTPRGSAKKSSALAAHRRPRSGTPRECPGRAPRFPRRALRKGLTPRPVRFSLRRVVPRPRIFPNAFSLPFRPPEHRPQQGRAGQFGERPGAAGPIRAPWSRPPRARSARRATFPAAAPEPPRGQRQSSRRSSLQTPGAPPPSRD